MKKIAARCHPDAVLEDRWESIRANVHHESSTSLPLSSIFDFDTEEY